LKALAKGEKLLDIAIKI